MKKRPTALQLHEHAIQAAPHHYGVALFTGRGQYMRAEVEHYETAVQWARQFYNRQVARPRRPAAIYAVQGHNQSHVCNITEESQKMTFLLTWKGGDYQGMKIERYIDMATAKDALNGIEDPAVGGVEVDDEMHLDYSKTVLVALFNRLAGPDDPQVQHFPNKSEGQRRVFARIETLAKNLPVLGVAVSHQQETTVAGKTKKTKAPKAKAEGNGVARKRLNQDSKIEILVEANPKREGTKGHAAFKLYRNGMLVSTFIEKGGSAADVRWDVDHKYIKLIKPEATA